MRVVIRRMRMLSDTWEMERDEVVPRNYVYPWSLDAGTEKEMEKTVDIR